MTDNSTHTKLTVITVTKDGSFGRYKLFTLLLPINSSGTEFRAIRDQIFYFYVAFSVILFLNMWIAVRFPAKTRGCLNVTFHIDIHAFFRPRFCHHNTDRGYSQDSRKVEPSSIKFRQLKTDTETESERMQQCRAYSRQSLLALPVYSLPQSKYLFIKLQTAFIKAVAQQRQYKLHFWRYNSSLNACERNNNNVNSIALIVRKQKIGGFPPLLPL